jgi:hypothetical protein
MLTESRLLSVIGGLAGLWCAVWIKDGLFAVGDWGGQEPSFLEPKLDLRVRDLRLESPSLLGFSSDSRQRYVPLE